MESMDPDPILRLEIVALLLGAVKDFSVSKGLRHFFLRRQEESVEGIFRLAGFDDYKCGVSGNGGGLCGDALRWTESDDEGIRNEENPDHIVTAPISSPTWVANLPYRPAASKSNADHHISVIALEFIQTETADRNLASTDVNLPYCLDTSKGNQDRQSSKTSPKAKTEVKNWRTAATGILHLPYRLALLQHKAERPASAVTSKPGQTELANRHLTSPIIRATKAPNEFANKETEQERKLAKQKLSDDIDGLLEKERAKAEMSLFVAKRKQAMTNSKADSQGF